MKLKILLLLLAFTALIVASEVMFQFRSNQTFRFYIYVYMAKASSFTSSVSTPLGFLGKAADIKIKEHKDMYQDLIPSDYKTKIGLPDEKPEISEKIRGHLKKIDVRSLPLSDPNNLAKTFYYLGLIAHRENQRDFVVPFWETAVYLAPWWSHFHVELANYYLLSGETEKAKIQLEVCINIPSPKEHCRGYLEDNLNVNLPFDAGFLEKQIESEI